MVLFIECKEVLNNNNNLVLRAGSCCDHKYCGNIRILGYLPESK